MTEDRTDDTAGGTTTWAALLAETSDVIGDRQHARWICEVAAGTDVDEFLDVLDDAPTVRMTQHRDNMIARYQAGEPLQYVLGRWGFRRLDLAVDRRVLIPRPETELVAEVALELARRFSDTRTVVDLGCGSGAIGLALADELPITGTTVWLTDASTDAVDVARANLAGLGRAAQNVQIRAGSWFDALPDDLVADVIVSNPPYVAFDSPALDETVQRWEPASALFAGHGGLDDLRQIISGATSRLVPGGWLVLEIGSDQGDAVRRLLDTAGFTETEIRADFGGHDRIAIGRRPSASATR